MFKLHALISDKMTHRGALLPCSFLILHAGVQEMQHARRLPIAEGFVFQQSFEFGINSLIFTLTRTCKAAITHTAHLHVTMRNELEFPVLQKHLLHPQFDRSVFSKPSGTGRFQHLKLKSKTYRIFAWALVLVTSVRYSSFS